MTDLTAAAATAGVATAAEQTWTPLGHRTLVQATAITETS